MTIIKKTRDNNNRQGCGVGRNVNWCNHHGKTIWKIFKKSKIEYYVIQQSHFWVFILRTWNPYLKEISTLLCSLQRLYPIQVCNPRYLPYDGSPEWMNPWMKALNVWWSGPAIRRQREFFFFFFFFFFLVFYLYFWRTFTVSEETLIFFQTIKKVKNKKNILSWKNRSLFSK